MQILTPRPLPVDSGQRTTYDAVAEKDDDPPMIYEVQIEFIKNMLARAADTRHID